jgi:aminopeptidase N
MGVGYTTGAPVAVVSEALDASDQVACIDRGVPAVQLFTGPTEDYHRPSDNAETIDAEGLVVVTEAVHETVGYLAERTEALTVTIAGSGEAAPESASSAQGERRASLGTMPDFAFEGEGVRVQIVMPDSAAEKAGIQTGDIVVALDGKKVTDLRSYSALLKTYSPGDAAEVALLREGEAITVKVVLGAR